MMPVSHWCVVINGTRLQEWHGTGLRIVTEGMALTDDLVWEIAYRHRVAHALH